MDSESIRDLVLAEIGDAWHESNYHGVDLRSSLLMPRLIKVIERNLRDGKIIDRVADAWLVLIEHPETDSGYRIIASKDGKEFGLASEGFRADEHPVVCGWYGDFMTTFHGM